MMTIVSAYRGKKLVYRSQYSYNINPVALDNLRQSWEDTGCRFTILRLKSPISN